MKPILALIYGASFWGFIWYPTRFLESMGLPGIWQLLTSYVSAMIVLLILEGFKLTRISQKPGHAILLIFAAGWTNVAFVLAVLNYEVARVLILFYLSPLWAIILGRWLLGERITFLTGVMLLLGLSGAALMLWDDGNFSGPLRQGDLLALSAGFCFALTNVLTRYLDNLSITLKTQLAWLGGIIVSLAFITFLNEPFPKVEIEIWIGSILLGVFGYFLATIVVVYAISRMPIQRSSIILLFELFVGAISAWLLAGEVMEFKDWLGGCIIVCSGMIAIFHGKKVQEKLYG